MSDQLELELRTSNHSWLCDRGHRNELSKWASEQELVWSVCAVCDDFVYRIEGRADD